MAQEPLRFFAEIRIFENDEAVLLKKINDFCAKSLDASAISVNEVQELIFSRSEKFIRFCAIYVAAESTLQQDQEYNPEEYSINDEPANETYAGHSKTFLFQYAIFYIMLEIKWADLVDFLKKIGHPKAARFSELLINLFNKN